MPEEQVAAGSPPAAEETPPTTEVVTAQDANPADTSAAVTDANPAPAESAKRSAIDVVRDVVTKKAEEAPSADGDPSDPPESGKQPDEPDADKAKGEDEKLPPFHTHPDWQKKIEANRALKAQVAELEPDAREFRSIRKFMDANKVSEDDVVESFKLAALVRTDPERAVVELERILGEVRVLAGDVLPDDLKKEVEEGTISEERARELSRARASAKRSKERVTEVQDENQERDAKQAAAASRKVLAEEIGKWEGEQAARDPNFAKKQPLIQDRVQTELQAARANGKTSHTPAEARALLDKAKKHVDEHLRSLVPPKDPKNPPLRTSNRPSPTQAPTPPGKKFSTLEIVQQHTGAGA